MEQNRFLIDSSVFVAFYYEGDAQHTDALRVMADISAQVLIVHPYVIQETATVLAYRLGMPVAKAFVTDVMKAKNVLIPAADVYRDAAFFLDYSKKMSFTDIALIGLARSMGVPIVTFDKQMLSAFSQTRRI
ncbi:type II toxin-antitoxin system VapC family toxin [Candidatus Parcubacteria bacterium]|nr:MAG: type II toxin-antitoxin system VapC family toxin [Candidatus Parcubacteria bacterium]